MTPWILSFDASTPRTVIAVGHRDASDAYRLVATDADEDAPNQASSRLAGRIQTVLRAAGITIDALGLIACGRGPGTFTGTRVAVATAKGLAVALGVHLLPVSTLAAVAASAPDAEGARLGLLDARRNEVYGALFELDGSTGAPIARTEELALPAASWVERCTTELGRLDVVPVGTGIAPYVDAFPPAWRAAAVVIPGPSPEGLWLATAGAHARGEAMDPAGARAVYLRKSYAELGVHPPKRPFVKSPFVP